MLGKVGEGSVRGTRSFYPSFNCRRDSYISVMLTTRSDAALGFGHGTNDILTGNRQFQRKFGAVLIEKVCGRMNSFYRYRRVQVGCPIKGALRSF